MDQESGSKVKTKFVNKSKDHRHYQNDDSVKIGTDYKRKGKYVETYYVNEDDDWDGEDDYPR